MNKKQRISFDGIAQMAGSAFVQYRLPFLAAIISGLLAYTYAFTNKLINPDEVRCMFTKGASLSSGRWGLDILSHVFPNYSIPWIYGIFSVLLLGVAFCMIIKLFRIRTPLFQMLLSSAIMVFPSMIGTVAYIYTLAPYAVSFLLAVAAAMLFAGQKKLGFLWAVILLTVSVGIYQSYIAITATLLVLLLLKETLYSDKTLGKLILEGVRYVVGLAVSLALYYLILQLLLKLKGTGLNAYAQNHSQTAHSVFYNIVYAYWKFYCVVFRRQFSLIPTVASQIAHIGLLLLTAIVIFPVWRRKNAGFKSLSVMLVFLLPLSINCMYLFVSAQSIHTLVLYGFAMLYVLICFVLDEYAQTEDMENTNKLHISKLCRKFAVVALAAIIIINVFISNIVYLRMYLCYENMYSYYSSVATQIKATPGFDEDSKVAFVGYARTGFHTKDYFDEMSTDITGTEGLDPNDYSRQEFINLFLGIRLPFANEQEIAEIKKTEAFADMAVYPYYGSVQKIGDYVVVKFEE